MIKKISLFLSIVLLTIASYAQTTAPAAAAQPVVASKWSKGGTFKLNLFENGYQNWVGAPDNVIGLLNLTDLFANYTNGKTTWDNGVKIKFGQTKLSSFKGFRKSDDILNLYSTYAIKANDKLSYAVNFDFLSQLMAGYTYSATDATVKTLNSDFLSPGKALLAVGIKYTVRDKSKDDFLKIFFSPLANRITYCADTNLAPLYIKVRPGEKLKGTTQQGGKNYRYELGASFEANYRKALMPRVIFSSKLMLFTDYLDKAHNVDLNLDALINFEVNQYISAYIGATTIYDDDISLPTYQTINDVKTQVGAGPKTQFRHSAGIGFTYAIK
jgi:hypothetical protein